jgi:hypothetical protein
MHSCAGQGSEEKGEENWKRRMEEKQMIEKGKKELILEEQEDNTEENE